MKLTSVDLRSAPIVLTLLAVDSKLFYFRDCLFNVILVIILFYSSLAYTYYQAPLNAIANYCSVVAYCIILY